MPLGDLKDKKRVRTCMGWVIYTKEEIVCQEKSTPRHGSVSLIHSSVSSASRRTLTITNHASLVKKLGR